MNWEDLIEQVDWEVYPVECDPYGDPDWKYHVVYKLNDKEVCDDYWSYEPDEVKIYNTLLESFKYDMFSLGGKYHSEWVA